MIDPKLYEVASSRFGFTPQQLVDSMRESGFVFSLSYGDKSNFACGCVKTAIGLRFGCKAEMTADDLWYRSWRLSELVGTLTEWECCELESGFMRWNDPPRDSVDASFYYFGQAVRELSGL